MLVILIVTLICDGQRTKVTKPQFDGQTLSMEGHNDKVFGEVNPEGA